MSSEAQKRKARHNYVNNGCDKKTAKCKYIAWFGKKMRYETGKRLIRKLLMQEDIFDEKTEEDCVGSDVL